MSLLSRWEVHGQENVPPTGPFLLAVNHCSYVDPVLLIVGVPRYLRFMVKSELYKPIAGQLLRAVGTFPVRRGLADREALATTLRLLKDGGAVVVFPEGTRSRNGRLLRGLPGTMALALRAEAPVLPAAIMGTEVVSGWLGIFRRPHMVLRIGEAYWPEKPGGMPASVAFQVATDDLMQRIAALLPEERRGAYAAEGQRNEQPRHAVSS
jgi:1-acyl-sn-glycerol-3-phosphate acyltransferase